jgi:hypothetical protein
MTEESISKVDNWYNRATLQLNQIKDVVIGYFGDDYVDVKVTSRGDIFQLLGDKERVDFADFTEAFNYNPSIIIWFPETTITNEEGISTIVKDLYAKLSLSIEIGEEHSTNQECTLNYGLRVTGSDYPLSHARADYLHSHLPGLPSRDDKWLKYCLGRGPITHTFASLGTAFDIELWDLLCVELDAMIKVESIKGVPYRYMSKIGKSNLGLQYSNSYNIYQYNDKNRIEQSTIASCLMNDFTTYFLANVNLPIVWASNSYTIGMPFLDFELLFTKEFIKWIERKDNEWTHIGLDWLVGHCIIMKSVIKDNKIYTITGDASTYYSENEIRRRLEGVIMLKFKGKDIIAKVYDDADAQEADPTAYIIHPNITNYFVSRLLRHLNYYYENPNTRRGYTAGGIQQFL